MDKILFVIPAYNEEANISKVLSEIKKDFETADVLVINDCSTDQTLEVLKKSKVKYISNIFNMGYAMAVQTGIKYAAIYDYDYVIQFDADGQHIAKEAVKLYEHAKKNNCDIVILEGIFNSKWYKNLFEKLREEFKENIDFYINDLKNLIEYTGSYILTTQNELNSLYEANINLFALESFVLFKPFVSTCF